MARKNDSILDLLVLLPWWVSVVSSAVVYVALAYVVPNLTFENQMSAMFFGGLSNIAHMCALVLLIPAPFAYLKQRQKSQRLDVQKNIDSIRGLSWREFEQLVGEAYRRQGYRVVENEGAGADGGVDLWLKKDGLLHLVQCKQWRSQKVGVPVVREMFGVMTAENAASVSIITSGMFTQEAKNFAHGKPIDLVDGAQLQQMIFQVQAKKTIAKTSESVAPALGCPVPVEVQSHLCPRCGAELVLRTAKKGPNKGDQFYGCSSFPQCRFTQQI
jgi:restriction system protein